MVVPRASGEQFGFSGDSIHVPSPTAPFPFISFSSPMMTLVATLEISQTVSYYRFYLSPLVLVSLIPGGILWSLGADNKRHADELIDVRERFDQVK